MEEHADARSRARGAGLCGLAVVMAGLVYLDALPNPFVYDDHLAVIENGSIRDLGNLREIVLQHRFRPMVNASYALDYAVWGLVPFGYHLTGLLLHLVNVALVFRLTWLAVGDRHTLERSPTGPIASPIGLAFVVAALFAVHPMMTEAVGYVSGRAEVLCGTFFLLGVLALRRAVVAASAPSLLAGLVCFALGLASREVAVMLPVVFLAYDRLLLGGSAEARRRRLWRLHLPLVGLALLLGVARVTAFFWFETQPPPVPVWQYVLMELGVVWRYVFLLLALLSQSVVHTVREVTTPFDPSALGAGAGLVALGVLAWRTRRRAPLPALGVAWFLLLLAPSSSLIPLGEAMAEHRVYLASWGVFLAVAIGGERLFAWLETRGVLHSRVVPRATVALVLATLALATVARNLVWADPVTLWRDAAQKASETWLPHYALADALRMRGRCAEAIPSYQRARDLRPGEPLVYANLGACLMEVGRLDEARQVFSAALRIDSASARAHNNLGVVALLAGSPDEARRHFEAALTRDPRHVLARQNLAGLFETTYANPAEALRLCREIESLAPGTAGVADCIRRNQDRATRGARRL